jgi:hypothetical protein
MWKSKLIYAFGLLFLLLNTWIWIIYSSSKVIFLLSILSSVALFLLSKRKEKFIYKILFFVVFTALLNFQFTTTDESSLTNLNNYQQWIQAKRIKEYPPVYISAFGKALWFPVERWFEEDTTYVSFYRLTDNVYQVLDLNLYFFGNHPRERLEHKEFQKFPYVVIPLFLLGVLKIAERKRIDIFVLSFLIPVVLLTVIGSKNDMGPFSLFPFIIVSILLGTEGFLNR